MRRALIHVLIGGCISAAFGVLAIIGARGWPFPMQIFLAPAAIVDWPPHDRLLRMLVRPFFATGGPSATLLVVVGTAFAAWFLAFTCASIGVVRWKQRGV